MTALFEDHLCLDAVVAFADGELSLVAYQRAAAHLSRCPGCAAEVAEQTAARRYLQTAPLPAMPGSLFESLKSIPLACPQPAAPDRREHHSRNRLFRMGAGALVVGVALGALVGSTPETPAPTPQRAVPSAASVTGVGATGVEQVSLVGGR